MPTVESVKKDLESLGTEEQEEILNYLEEIMVLASYAAEITNEVKESSFARGKICPHCGNDEAMVSCGSHALYI